MMRPSKEFLRAGDRRHRSGLNQFSRRYIVHLLARVTAYDETQSGRPDLFPSYVDRTARNAGDIEHITANSFERHGGGYASRQEFEQARDGIRFRRDVRRG